MSNSTGQSQVTTSNMGSTPKTYADAVRAMAREHGLDLTSNDPAKGKPAAMYHAAKVYPALHQAWREAGFPPVGQDSGATAHAEARLLTTSVVTFADVVKNEAKKHGFDLSSNDPDSGLPAAIRRGEWVWPSLHARWRADGCPPIV